MFEKEAETVFKKKAYKIAEAKVKAFYKECGWEDYKYMISEFADVGVKCYQKGAEFGYNKANEWHYVKDGDYPKDNIQVLVLLENKRLKTSIFMENKFTVWNKDYNTYTKLYNVIAWKEIVLPELPKEIKEND